MELSDLLVKQFTEVTKDATKTDTKNRTYATVKSDGVVVFDGSDQSTPCASTVKVNAGDRVIVEIVNHQAVITGNLTSEALDKIATIRLVEGKIETKVSKDDIISVINQTAEEVKIQASKISFEGLVTANDYFKILTDGSIVAASGKIAGFNISSDVIRKTATLNGVKYDYFFQAADGDKTTNVFAVRTSSDEGSTWEFPFRVNYQGNTWVKTLNCSSIVLSTHEKVGDSTDNEFRLYYGTDVNEPIFRPDKTGLSLTGYGRVGTSDYPLYLIQTQHLRVAGTDVTSDRKLKNHVASLESKVSNRLMKATSESVIPSDISENFIYGLTPSVYTFKDERVLDSKMHFGFYAQDVYELLHKLCPEVEFGAASATIKDSGDADTPYDPKTGEKADEELKWYLSYTELIAPLVAVVQKQKQQLDELSSRLDALETEMKNQNGNLS